MRRGLAEAPVATRERVLDRHERLLQRPVRIRYACRSQTMHEMAERVRGDHDAPGRPVVVPPPLITLRTEEIRERGELEQYALLGDRLRQIDVFMLGEDCVVWNRRPDVQLHQATTGLLQLGPGRNHAERWAHHWL